MGRAARTRGGTHPRSPWRATHGPLCGDAADHARWQVAHNSADRQCPQRAPHAPIRRRPQARCRILWSWRSSRCSPKGRRIFGTSIAFDHRELATMTLEPFFDDFFDETPLPVARASARPLAALMEDRFEYPDRTAFVAADSASFGSSFARAASEDRPVLIVMPDGVEFLYEPAPGLVASLRRRLRSRLAAHRLREMGPLVTDPSESGWVDTDPVPIPGYRHRLRGPRPASAAS